MKSIALCLALGLGVNMHSQTVDIERGDAHLEIFEFEKAIEEYKKAYSYDTTSSVATRKIAEAYRRKGDLSTSAEWYEKTMSMDPSKKEDMLHYAEALKSQKKYEESLEWYRKYNSLEPEDERASNHIESETLFEDLTMDSTSTIVKSLVMNNKKPAIGVAKFEEKLLISAVDLGGDSKGNKTNPWNDLPYVDVYEGTIGEYNEIVDITAINEINSKYNDGPAHFSSALQTVFVTRNNMKRGKPVKDKTGSVNLKIYASKLVDDEWQEIYELPFNSNDYSSGHPCITKDGKFMYFASNMPGGSGGTDIYVCENINDTWSEPINLGNNLNTKGDEMFPYVDDNNVLYFSSTGHAGLGGLDIFKVPLADIHKEEPENLGTPLNSSKDDFSIMFEQTDVSGYFCTNRERGFADNVFYFEINNLLRKILAGRIKSSLPEKSLAGTELIIRNKETLEEEVVTLDDTGEFEFNGEAGQSYELAYQKEDVEEILGTKSVEAVISSEYENLGVFTIYERMDITVYDDKNEVVINDVMYKRFQEEGEFISEKGDTLSNTEMMDIVTHNFEDNDVSLNDHVFNYNEETNEYIDDEGNEIPEEALEQLLIGEIFANPLDTYDGSLIANVNTPFIGNYIDVASSSSNENENEEMEISAMTWIDNQLAAADLTELEMERLEVMKADESLNNTTASEYLDAIVTNPEMINNLSYLEQKAIGVHCKTDPGEDISAHDYIKLVLEGEELSKSETIELEALSESSLVDVSAADWLEVYRLDPEKAENISGVEKMALGLTECDTDLTAEEWVDIALTNEKLSVEQEIELLELRKTGELADISAVDYLEKYAENEKLTSSLTEVERIALDMLSKDNVTDYVMENNPENTEGVATNASVSPKEAAALANAVNIADIKPLELENPSEYVLNESVPMEAAAAELGLEEIYFDFDQSYITKNAQTTLDHVTSVLLANEDVKMYVNAHTDARGSDVYNHYLSEKRAISVKNYLKARGVNPSRLELNWFGESELANTCENGVSCGENAHKLNRRALFKLSKSLTRTNDHINVPEMSSAAPEEIFSPFETGDTANLNAGLDDDELLGRAGLEMIYYDYNKSNIRRDAQLILEVVAAAMKSNSKSLSINAHTDSRGNSSYNAELSQKRALEAKNYLIAQGISADRIEINWSGEVQLANKCYDNTNCSENQHQENRRASLVWK